MKSFVALALVGLLVAPLCVIVSGWSSRRRSQMKVYIPPDIKANKSSALFADRADEPCTIRQLGSSATKVFTLHPGEYEIVFTSYLPGPSWQTQIVLPMEAIARNVEPPPPVMTVDAKAAGSKEIVLWSADQTGKPLGSTTVVTVKQEWMPVRVEWGEGATHLVVAAGASKDTVMIRKGTK